MSNVNIVTGLEVQQPALLGVLAILLVAMYLRLGGQTLKVEDDDSGDDGDEATDEQKAPKECMVERLLRGERRLLILWGSETGTAEAYATRFARDVRSRLGITSLICNPQDESVERLDQLPSDCLLALFPATHDEGEPTRNNEGLLSLLESDKPMFSCGTSLSTLRYSMFGLGNSTYEHFNASARRMDAALQGLGAQRLGVRGEGDDDRFMEDDYSRWFEGAISEMADHFSVAEHSATEISDFVVREVGGVLGPLPPPTVPFGHDSPFPAPIRTMQLFNDKAERHCVHATFDLSSSNMDYAAGDHLGLWPINPDTEVDRVLRLFCLDTKADTVIEISAVDSESSKVPIAQPTTYRLALRHSLDICGLASRKSVQSLATHAPSPEAAAVLSDFTLDAQEFAATVAELRWSLADVLDILLPGVFWSVPFDLLLSSIPPLQPRFYSISSSPLYDPGKVTITAVVLKYKPEPSSRRCVHGLASNYLHAMHMAQSSQSLAPSFPRYSLTLPHDGATTAQKNPLRARVHLRPSKFRLPAPTTPVIMIGPGTGVAPFRGFVQERVVCARRVGPLAVEQWGDMLLYYGCRRKDEDFLYQTEWPKYQQELSQKLKDLLWEDRAEVVRLIQEGGAHIYICGDGASMSKCVLDVLGRMIAENHGDATDEDATAAVRELKEAHRISLDVW